MGGDIIKDLIDILPQIIIYIVTGYVFVKTFHFVALKQNSIDVEHILTSSLVIGYIYCSIANLIPFSVSYELDTIGIIISALVLGYFIGRLLRCKWIVYILDWLKIRDTGNSYLWDDIMDNDYPMKVVVSYENIIYEGMLHNYESYSNEPHVVLGAYTIKNIDNDIIEDMSNSNDKIVILNTATAISVKIIYNKKSNECKDIDNLIKYSK